MIHLGNMIVLDSNEPLLMEVDPKDLIALLELPPEERLTRIVELNRTQRYSNRLNAFALMERLSKIIETVGKASGD